MLNTLDSLPLHFGDEQVKFARDALSGGCIRGRYPMRRGQVFQCGSPVYTLQWLEGYAPREPTKVINLARAAEGCTRRPEREYQFDGEAEATATSGEKGSAPLGNLGRPKL